MKRIFVCSPFAGDTKNNVLVAQRLCLKAMTAGHAPFAPHLLYPGFMDDAVPAHREAGIACGLAYLETCDEIWAYVGSGISSGMRREIELATALGKPVIHLTEV
jgi:nucleoside 2-deoxyribosyltransferase